MWYVLGTVLCEATCMRWINTDVQYIHVTYVKEGFKFERSLTLNTLFLTLFSSYSSETQKWCCEKIWYSTQNPWNLTKLIRDAYFLKNHLPYLVVNNSLTEGFAFPLSKCSLICNLVIRFGGLPVFVHFHFPLHALQ